MPIGSKSFYVHPCDSACLFKGYLMTSTSAAGEKSSTFEQELWSSADKLRGAIEPPEYKHVVLSLLFLKFASEQFYRHRKALVDLKQEAFLEVKEFYVQNNVFFVPAGARWRADGGAHEEGCINWSSDDLPLQLDAALKLIEKHNAVLKDALPTNYFSRIGLEAKTLKSICDGINRINTVLDKSAASVEDVFGRVYEYFLSRFATAEGKRGGEFYTPKCIVSLLVSLLKPFSGKVYDPCCGSGGMFVQSAEFIRSHQGRSVKDLSIYGQEFTQTTYKLAKMNLAVHGIRGNLGEMNANTFFADQHPDLKADFILANPPFNLSDWRKEDELTSDPRWSGYETPSTGNANSAWILHMLSKLSESGTCGFVMANGSMSSMTKTDGAIRRQLVENDHVECMIALPGQLFYTTQIPVCLWILTKSKKAVESTDPAKVRRARQGEILFIDARKMGSMISRVQKELTAEDLAQITSIYHNWRGDGDGGYEDVAGLCKSAMFEEVKAHDFVLTPGRYVGAAEVEDDGEPFEEKMERLTGLLSTQMAESVRLDVQIRLVLEGIGYDV